MSIEGIDISLDQVNETAGEISKINGQLVEKLNLVQTEMKNLTNSWQSEASTAIQESFNALATKYFDNYRDIVENYSTFLKETVRTYTETENHLKSNASAFK